MTLRSHRVTEAATLPDGREVVVDVGLAEDDYIRPQDNDTVSIELRNGGQVLAVLNTVLGPEDDSEARALAREVAAGLASGELEPTAEAIEPLADRPR